MKNTLMVLLISITFSLLSCSDPCEGVSCLRSVNEYCDDGKCQCEIENYSYLTWTFDCTNCTSNIETLFINVELNGAKLQDLSLWDFQGHRATITNERLTNMTGNVPYKITSGSVTLEEGFINLNQCQITTTTSLFSI